MRITGYQYKFYSYAEKFLLLRVKRKLFRFEILLQILKVLLLDFQISQKTTNKIEFVDENCCSDNIHFFKNFIHNGTTAVTTNIVVDLN